MGKTLGVLALVPTAFLGALLFVPILFAQPTAAGGRPTAAAREEIPTGYLALYRQAAAQRCPGLPWSVLAAVGAVESRHGRNTGPSSAGALGPMQFLPGVWSEWGSDSDGDGNADVHSPADAIHSAARYLCHAGADQPGQLRQALWAYNHSTTYVDQVLTVAQRYATSLLTPTATDEDASELADRVLSHPRIAVYAGGQADIAAGRIDPRVLRTLLDLARDHDIAVSSLTTGHGRCVGGGTYQGCKVSAHAHGQAVDIYKVDDRPVSPSNSTARRIVDEAAAAAAAAGEAVPDEIGSPWAAYEHLPGHFTDQAHQDHIHLGWEGKD